MKIKKVIAVIAAVMILGSAGAAFAASTAKTPADIVSGLTGKTLDELYNERAGGKTYGTIANDAGKLEEFKAQMQEQKKAVLDQRVKDSTLTQQQADAIYNNIKNNQAACTGTGNGQTGRNSGAGFGRGMGRGAGMGQGMGRGAGMGYGGVCTGLGVTQ
jgi:hypothetical protein